MSRVHERYGGMARMNARFDMLFRPSPPLQTTNREDPRPNEFIQSRSIGERISNDEIGEKARLTSSS